MNAAIINDVSYCKMCKPTQFVVSTTTAAGPTPMAAALSEFRYAIVTALKTEAGGANTGAVKIGANSGANKQPIALNPGDAYVLPVPPGAKSNFQDWFFTVANDNDGLLILAF